MSRLWSIDRATLVERSFLALPIGFSIGFGLILLFSGELAKSPVSVVFLLLTPLVGAVGLRWKRWRGWLTLVMTALSYEALAEVIDSVADSSRLLSLFDFDRYLWGFNLTGRVQSSLSSASMTDVMAVLYQLLMPVVVVTSLVVWRRSGQNFGKYVTAMLLTSYAALVTFLFIPTAPPWLTGAANNLVRASGLASIPSFLSPLAALVEPDEFAAFPSLHAAYMVICSYFLLKVDRRIGGAAVLLTGGVLLSTLYLGQHYLVDLLAGVGYAIAPCLISERLQFFGSKKDAPVGSVPALGGTPGGPGLQAHETSGALRSTPGAHGCVKSSEGRGR